ncbi:AAA family ATPase [Methylobacterium sp. Leaf117]|uniref:AAA family ATPase n=1 Tax=Methylobacterium sp. Leaf117 TaxID=1736260 RepID=UPI0009EAC83F|nr:AAA family ATPase [Methylobacterium sp. Leaf117]
MPTLVISDFSCIKEANLTLAPVNVIIGPQGSGKSVTTKLTFFFSDIMSNFQQAAERGDTIEDYKRSLSRSFNIWFPPSAWGQGRFNISYVSGAFSARVLRRKSQGKLRDDVSITFSEWFTDSYKRSADLFDKTRSGEEIEDLNAVQVGDVIDRTYRVRDVIHRKMLAELGNDFVSRQTFVPAGRAFFTSIGRLVAGFEQAGSLDPITIKFARLFANIRDRSARRFSIKNSRLSDEFHERRFLFMSKLFGGEIKFEQDTEFVETEDGRKIPFSSLSSGQQELLPMWSLMDYFSEMDALRFPSSRRSSRRSTELIYIEEPEAHLFPSAQSLLLEFLIGSIASERNQRSLILTTHSPYIMANLNVFLKAGQLARRKKRNQDINNVVPRECWLTESQLSAFAIEDGKLRSLIDDDLMIDGRYLDQISEDISRQFSKLLQIESEI